MHPGFPFLEFPKMPTTMRAGRQEGSGEECRPALHLVFAFRLFPAILRFLRNCGSFYLKFELFSLKIPVNETAVSLRDSIFIAPSLRSALGKGGRRTGGVGEGLRPPFLICLHRVSSWWFFWGGGGEKYEILVAQFHHLSHRLVFVSHGHSSTRV